MKGKRGIQYPLQHCHISIYMIQTKSLHGTIFAIQHPITDHESAHKFMILAWSFQTIPKNSSYLMYVMWVQENLASKFHRKQLYLAYVLLHQTASMTSIVKMISGKFNSFTGAELGRIG